MENPRGFAFTAAKQSYNRWRLWDWGYYANRLGIMPSEGKFLYDFITLYDKGALTLDTSDDQEVRDFVAHLIDYFYQQYYKDVQGKWGKSRTDGTYLKVAEGIDRTNEEDNEELSYIDSGYELVEQRLAVQSFLRLIKPQLEEWEYSMLVQYLEYGGSMRQAAMELGLGQSKYDRARRRIARIGKEIGYAN